jgi:hypothetical protein
MCSLQMSRPIPPWAFRWPVDPYPTAATGVAGRGLVHDFVH